MIGLPQLLPGEVVAGPGEEHQALLAVLVPQIRLAAHL
jgi:hypothetical protein